MKQISESHPLTKALRSDERLRDISLPGLENPYVDLPDYLVSKGLLPRDEMLTILEDLYETPAWPLMDATPDQELLVQFPREYCDDTCAFPFASTENYILAAMADPWDIEVRTFIETKSGKKIIPIVALKSDLLDAVKFFFESSSHLGIEIKTLMEERAKAAKREKIVEIIEGKDSPVVRLTNYILQQGLSLSASDIHLEPLEGRSKLRYRIDGVLHLLEGPPPGMYEEVVSRIKVMANLDVAETRIPQDGRITLRDGGRTIEFRVSTIRFVHGEGVVLRILEKTGVAVDIRKLGFPEDLFPIFDKAIKSPHGLILVSGPTGSGKSTTLYAVLLEIATEDKKVISVEEPVEYKIDAVCQSAVRADIGYTFDSGMRAILRHDPDIIMIGEMRDRESAEMAIRAALTGHLVLSTIHTNDSVSAVTRLIDMGIPDFLVSATLRLVIAQRLARKLCSHCRRPKTVGKEVLEQLNCPPGYLEKIPDTVTLYESVGCEACKKIGYKGRQAVFEILDAGDLFRKVRNRNMSLQELTEEALRLGLRNLRVNGIMLALSGETSLEEVIKITSEY